MHRAGYAPCCFDAQPVSWLPLAPHDAGEQPPSAECPVPRGPYLRPHVQRVAGLGVMQVCRREHMPPPNKSCERTMSQPTRPPRSGHCWRLAHGRSTLSFGVHLQRPAVFHSSIASSLVTVRMVCPYRHISRHRFGVGSRSMAVHFPQMSHCRTNAEPDAARNRWPAVRSRSSWHLGQ